MSENGDAVNVLIGIIQYLLLIIVELNPLQFTKSSFHVAPLYISILYPVMESPLFNGLENDILTPPVDESIEVVGALIYAGVIDALMVVADENDPHPHSLYALTLN